MLCKLIMLFLSAAVLLCNQGLAVPHPAGCSYMAALVPEGKTTTWRQQPLIASCGPQAPVWFDYESYGYNAFVGAISTVEGSTDVFLRLQKVRGNDKFTVLASVKGVNTSASKAKTETKVSEYALIPLTEQIPFVIPAGKEKGGLLTVQGYKDTFIDWYPGSDQEFRVATIPTIQITPLLGLFAHDRVWLFSQANHNGTLGPVESYSVTTDSSNKYDHSAAHIGRLFGAVSATQGELLLLTCPEHPTAASVFSWYKLNTTSTAATLKAKTGVDCYEHYPFHERFGPRFGFDKLTQRITWGAFRAGSGVEDFWLTTADNLIENESLEPTIWPHKGLNFAEVGPGN